MKHDEFDFLRIHHVYSSEPVILNKLCSSCNDFNDMIELPEI